MSEEPTVSTPGWAVMGPVLDRGIRLVKREVWAWRPGWLMAAVLGGAEERIEVEVDLYRCRGGAEMTKQSTQ